MLAVEQRCHSAARCGGGIIAQIITYPLQTVNTRQQTERIAKKKRASPDRNVLSFSPGGPSSPFGCGGTLFQILEVIQSEGWGGLYSGLKPSLVGTAASQLLKNKVEAAALARKKKGHGDGTLGMFSWLIVAAIAGSVNVLLTNPIWVLVTRMQTHTQAEKKMLEARKEDMLKEFSEKNSSDISDLKRKLAELDLFKPHPYGTFHAAHEIYREAGIKGFWKGLVPTLIMLKRYGTKHEGKKLTALESRLQAKQEIGSNAMLRYTGTFDAIKKMIRYEGLKGFYKGMGTKIVQSVFAASVLFMVKEELVKALMFLADESQKILH
ncbi:Peroxisomal nicotinamide adenine dinucleotide carrier [Ananas comosus]|uniref:Peroxisomal nicotinamide adenine dinucleotide carrier n=1 Tax=Ananas comosus TaxID=4615 RepID=A0A199W897_ANACO|nr:Peroxisomal nicotinamide adenine dinucleotide carrier [Ananas comosus]